MLAVRFVDFTLKLLGLSQAIGRWRGILMALDGKRREKIAHFASEIADTIQRAADAFDALERTPNDQVAFRIAIRELSRLTGYLDNVVGVLEGHVDGRSIAGARRRLEGLALEGLITDAVRRADARRIERLMQAEGYFRALADALRI